MRRFENHRLKIIKLLIFIICFLSCNQQKTSYDFKPILDHFGSLKIGMERNQFQNIFQTYSKTKDDGYKIGYCIQKLIFNKTIILDTVYAEFEKDKLVYIGTTCNDELIIYLKKKFGGKNESINTNSKNIYCAVEKSKSHCAIGLYKKGWCPDYN